MSKFFAIHGVLYLASITICGISANSFLTWLYKRVQTTLSCTLPAITSNKPVPPSPLQADYYHGSITGATIHTATHSPGLCLLLKQIAFWHQGFQVCDNCLSPGILYPLFPNYLIYFSARYGDIFTVCRQASLFIIGINLL